MHAGYGSGFQVGPVHDRGVQFVVTAVGKHRAFAGVEPGALFKLNHTGLYRIQTAAALFQDIDTRLERLQQCCVDRLFVFAGQNTGHQYTGTAMQGHRNGLGHWACTP